MPVMFCRENSFGNIVRALLYTNTALKYNTYPACIICKGIFIAFFISYTVDLVIFLYRLILQGGGIIFIYNCIVLQFIYIIQSSCIFDFFFSFFVCFGSFILIMHAHISPYVRRSIYVINIIFATPSTPVIKIPHKHNDLSSISYGATPPNTRKYAMF